MTHHDSALDVICPICGVGPGEPCEDVHGGWVTTQLMAHLYRLKVAREDSQ